MALVNKEVLILDDDKDLRVMLRKILETAGLVVSEAASVGEALKKMKKRMPHLVILDLNLEGETGFQFLEQMRSEPSLSSTPVMVLSGTKDKTWIYRAIGLGAKDYIGKPLNATVILQKVRRAFALDVEAAKVVFPPQARPKIHMVIPGRVLKLGEAGFVVEGPVKLMALDTSLNIGVRGPLLDEAGATKIVCKPVSKRPTPSLTAPGQYLTEFTFSGMNETVAAKIRRIIKNWK